MIQLNHDRSKSSQSLCHCMDSWSRAKDSNNSRQSRTVCPFYEELDSLTSQPTVTLDRVNQITDSDQEMTSYDKVTVRKLPLKCNWAIVITSHDTNNITFSLSKCNINQQLANKCYMFDRKFLFEVIWHFLFLLFNISRIQIQPIFHTRAGFAWPLFFSYLDIPTSLCINLIEIWLQPKF